MIPGPTPGTEPRRAKWRRRVRARSAVVPEVVLPTLDLAVAFDVTRRAGQISAVGVVLARRTPAGTWETVGCPSGSFVADDIEISDAPPDAPLGFVVDP